jgi:hypothetical protein
MALDLWTPEFCLGCDKQTDGAAYCSESCRLAEFESSSAPSSGASSPSYTTSSYPWTTSKQPSAKFQLSPAYDFRNPQPYGSTPLPPSYLSQRSEPSTLTMPTRVLTPSSSHSSLCSMQSTSSAGSESAHLSDKAKRELRAYASSFEQVRMQRRRSY